MINIDQPIYVVLPMDEQYEHMNDIVVSASEYDFPFTIKAFADFIEDVVGTLLPTNAVNSYNSALEKAFIFVGPMESSSLVFHFQQDIGLQIRHLQLPVYPVAGYVYRFYITGDLNLHIHYEHQTPQYNINKMHTRDDILASINNGDYVSERIKRQYGI